jgi:hypothetical protein
MQTVLPAPTTGTMLDSPLFQREKASQALAEALILIKRDWGLSDEQISRFIHIPRPTVNHWLKQKRVPVEKPGAFTPTTEAVLHLIAIHRSLFSMFDLPDRQKAWIFTPHPVMKESPADIMNRSVEGLCYVRRYLDYLRGRGA